MLFVPRRVSPLHSNKTSGENPIRRLDETRNQAAWVLLGEPGAGKSLAFETEANATGGLHVSVAKFLSDDPDPSWQGKTLFLDGLDETRASGGDTGVLLKLRAYLKKLSNPRFRIACRAADWFGSTDSQAIGDVSPDGLLAIYSLEPLNASEAQEILRQNHAISDTEGFVEKARERGIDGLLRNPQTLLLLAESIRHGHWPNTRQETFELACKKLAEEDSKTHRVQRRDQAVSTEQILEAAGQLCAVLLLADKTGLALDTGCADPQYPSIDDLLPADLPVARLAAHRKLFVQSPDGEERMVPTHRSVAEYLAARWLARQVDQRGLPLQRVTSLFFGRDERTVAGLRGLYGWLALHCRAARRRLIEADPVTVVVYGDAKPMALEDKRALLGGLKQEAKQHLGYHWEVRSVTPFGALADEALSADFVAALTMIERDDASQVFVDCVLTILDEGEVFPELACAIKSVAVDESRWLMVRRNALGVWLKLAPPLEEAMALLHSINERRLADAYDELAGKLLAHLYPGAMAPEKLLDYLHPPKKRNYTGRYSMFWVYDLPRTAPDAHLPTLLDQLAARSDLDVPKEIKFSFDCRRMMGALLSRALVTHGDAIAAERLFAWLGVGTDKYGECHREKEHAAAIADWLGKRPERYKAVLSLCYRHCESVEHLPFCIDEQKRRLHGATAPEDIGLWHLERASTSPNDALAESHLGTAVYSLEQQEGCAGLSLEAIEAWADANPERKHWLGPMLTREIPEWRQENAARKKAEQITRETRRQEKSARIFKHFSAIRDGTAAPGILHELAGVWMDHYADTRGDTPAERFESYCKHGDELLKAAEVGFVQCPLRNDLPSVAEIIDLSINRRDHFIRQPCLVGMELRGRQGASLVDTLPDDGLRRMLAFRLTYGADNTPDWFTHLVQARPALVAEILVEYASATLNARQDYISGTDSLAVDPVYRRVSELAVPHLLAGFPVRAKSTQMSHLERLLKAAMRYTAPQLLGLLDKKLAAKGMDVAQKVYWLTTAMLLDPEKHEPQLWRYIGNNWTRANHLCVFLDDGFDGISNDYALSPGTLGKLIELLSPHAEFEQMSGLVSAPMRRGDAVRSMVTRLGAQASDEAAREIERLLAVPSLVQLKPALEKARHQLKLKQREGDFRFPPLASVARILSNREPTGAADLAALTVDCLDRIANRIRNDNDDGFRLFWNVENKQPTGKREENLCRDYLLTRLRSHLETLGIECQPEGDYVNEKRADIRISYRNDFEVPIEIKRDDNPGLWSALRKQLMDQYTIAPKAGGYGIYLVLWFGRGDQATARDGGKKSVSPEELQSRLEALLDTEERRRIFVRVLDVGWPVSR